MQPSVDSSSEIGAELPQISLSDELPWLLRRSAILDLRLHESPTPTDYELSANLLDIASEFAPENAELMREVAQASWLAGDQQMMLDATRRVIKIDPLDSVAQLRLISATINMRQTVEGRKAMYDRFLSDAGKSIDPAVRSRLALDAALLERETGNTSGFVERLHQATRLDITNKPAASLAAQFYSSIRNDPVTNFDYQIRLLYADPLDANVHLTIARLLARQGALAASQRFLGNAIDLYTLETGTTPENIEEIRIAVEWQVDGHEEVMGRLAAIINDRRVTAEARIRAYEEQLLPTDSLIKPEDIRFTLGIDKMRLLAAHGEGDAELVRSVLLDIENSVNAELLRLGKMASVRGVNMNALFTQVVLKITELQGMRALVGLDAEKIRSDIEGIIDQQPAMSERLESIEPLALFAEKRYEEALVVSEPFKSSPVVALIRAQCFEHLGRVQEAIDLYLEIAHSNAINFYGGFASARLKAVGAGQQILTDPGKEMVTIANKLPSWIDQMIQRPGSFLFLRAEQDETIYREGEQPELTIRMQNTAPIPLALGPSAPIDSRLLIEPVGMKTNHNAFIGEPRSNVLQLDQRLRLMPREELTVRVAAESATTDWLIDQQPSIAMRLRWRVIQSYRPRITDNAASQTQDDPNARVYGITKSPLGMTAETQVVQRLGLSAYRAEPNELISMLTRGVPEARRRAVLAINAHLMNPKEEDRFDSSTTERLILAINDAFTRANTLERAAMLLILPHRHQVPQMIGFDDHVAASLLSDALIDSKADPTVLACALLTRTDDPDAPIFETLEHVSDERVLRIATIIRARLHNNEPMIGTVGPGFDAMTPTFDGLDY